MDQFQATPGPEVAKARHRSAAIFGDQIVCEAAKAIRRLGGDEALDEFRKVALHMIEAAEAGGPIDELAREFAVEEVERATCIARSSPTDLRGWHSQDPVAIEERKP